MRKKTAISALLLALLALAGCQEGSANTLEDTSLITSNEHCEAISTNSERAKDPLSREECVQIAALLKAWGELDYNIHPDQTNSSRGDFFPECVNTERFLDEELTVRGGTRTYTERFFLIESGDFATEASFNGKLDEMFTEGFKTRYFESTAGQMFRFKDGEVYVAGFGWMGLTASEAVRLEISTNGDMITITAQDSANGEFTATLERSESGFKIAGVGDGAMSGLPLLFSGGAAVDVYFGEEFAFRI